jgi:hypothetical protein
MIFQMINYDYLHNGNTPLTVRQHPIGNFAEILDHLEGIIATIILTSRKIYL